jgi:hypothetical protein
MNAHVVRWIRIRPFTCTTHDFRDVVVAKEGRAALGSTKHSDGFPCRSLQEIGPMDAAHGRGDRVQDRVLCALEFSNTEISGALIESKSDMDRNDSALEIRLMQCCQRDQLVLSGVENKVSSKESQSLSRPLACIESGGDGVIPVAGFQPSLGILGDARSGEQAKPSPVVDCVLDRQESNQFIWFGFDEAFEGSKHVDGIGLLFGSGLGPGCPLSQLLPEIGVQVDSFLLQGSGINHDTRSIGKYSHAVGSRRDVVTESLFTKRAFTVRRERVSLANPVEICSNEFDG